MYFHQHTECLHRVNVRFEECFIAAEAKAKSLPFSCDGVNHTFRPETGYPPKCDSCLEKKAAAAREAELEARKKDVLERINSYRRRPSGWIPRSLSTSKKSQRGDEEDAGKTANPEPAPRNAGRSDDRGEPGMIRHGILIEADLARV